MRFETIYVIILYTLVIKFKTNNLLFSQLSLEKKLEMLHKAF